MREGTRLQAGLVLESGEPREVHHFATLIGYGASAINPYLLLDTRRRAGRRRAACPASTTSTTAQRNVVKAIGKGLLKTISKMGISTIQSYCGAQIFEAVGLERELVDRHFTGTASRIGGIGAGRARAARRSSATRAASAGDHDDLLPVGGVYAWRRDGEHHMWNPETIALLQHAVAPTAAQPTATTSTRKLVNEDAARRATLRGLLKFRDCPRTQRLAARRGRAGEGDRQALRHRRDVARLDLDARRTRRSRSR